MHSDATSAHTSSFCSVVNNNYWHVKHKFIVHSITNKQLYFNCYCYESVVFNTSLHCIIACIQTIHLYTELTLNNQPMGIGVKPVNTILGWF